MSKSVDVIDDHSSKLNEDVQAQDTDGESKDDSFKFVEEGGTKFSDSINDGAPCIESEQNLELFICIGSSIG